MIDWDVIQQHWDWLGHIAEALVMAFLVMVLLLWRHRWQMGLALGLAFATGHFHGREKRDYEIATSLSPPHLEGYFVWRWEWDQVTDFWPVFITASIIGYLLLRRF